MDTELRSLLIDLGIWMAIGALVGLVVRRLRPDWQRRWTKFVLNRQWKLFGLAAILFGAGTVFALLEGNKSYAVLCGLMCLLELYVMFRYGFQSLTPEMEERIDAS